MSYSWWTYPHENALNSPHLTCAVITPADEGQSIGTDCYTHDTASMTSQGAYFLACAQSPYPDHAIFTATDEGESISTECYTPNSVYMVSEGAYFLACAQ